MFNIKIQIEENKNFSKLEDPIEYDDDLDDITSLVMDICNYLDEVGLVSFIVEGFKAMKWPVDVRTDLSSILPQIPDAIKKLAGRRECDIQFFEQGIERELRFKCGNGDVTIECFSLLGDLATTEIEKIQYDELIMMFKALMDSFIKISKRVCPKITNHYLFKEWESAYYDASPTQFAR